MAGLMRLLRLGEVAVQAGYVEPCADERTKKLIDRVHTRGSIRHGHILRRYDAVESITLLKKRISRADITQGVFRLEAAGLC